MSPNRMFPPAAKTHRTIGFLAASFDREMQASLIRGLSDGLDERGANLICFIGDAISSSGKPNYTNVIYDLVQPEMIGGLVIHPSSLWNPADRVEIESFLKRYAPLPVVSVGQVLPGIPSLMIDPLSGMRSACTHLIEKHDRQRIALIRGPEDNLESSARSQAYVETLSDFGLPFDPALIPLPCGGWTSSDAASVIDDLIVNRRVHFDAVIVTTDLLALGVVDNLLERGLSVPGDVCVVTYDKHGRIEMAVPSMTTIRQPFYKLGKTAAEAILASLDNLSVPERTILPEKLIVRKSCGCHTHATVRVPSNLASGGINKTVKENGYDVLKSIRDSLEHEFEGYPIDDLSGWIDQLLDSFIVTMIETDSNQFHPTLSHVLHQASLDGECAFIWPEILTAMQHSLMPFLVEPDLLSRAEELWQKTWVMVHEASQRAITRQRQKADESLRRKEQFHRALDAASDTESLMEVIAQELKSLSIPGSYLAYYQDPLRPMTMAIMKMAFSTYGRNALKPGGLRFPTTQIIPPELLPRDDAYKLVVAPLYSNQLPIGLIAFELSTRQQMDFEYICREINRAIGATIVAEQAKREPDVAAPDNLAAAASAQTDHHSADVDISIGEADPLRSLIDHLPDRIYVKDTQSRFLIANLAIAHHTGVEKPADLIGKSDLDFYPPEYAAHYLEDERVILESGDALLNREEISIDARGNLGWTLTTKIPLKDSQGQVIGIAGIGRDITPYKKMEEEREKFLSGLEQRTLRLQTAADVARAIGSILDLDELIQKVVDLVRERFNLYYVGLFLVDEAHQSAVLRAGTGEAGIKMVANGWKLPIGGGSMIGRCIAHGKADIQLDVEKAQVHLRNPHLPDTRSEMALPLISRGRVIGALTIQSTQMAAFSEDDITILQTMASQIANAIENSRLFEQTQRTLKEIEATHQRYLLQSWSTYSESLALKGYRQKDTTLEPLGSQLLPEVQQAVQERDPVFVQNDQDSTVLVVPILLRDQPIGAWGIKTERVFNEDEIKMVEAIADQFAIAAETLRLLDQTQRRAVRERLVTEITTKIRASNDPEAILQIALAELRQALKVERAQIVKAESEKGPDSDDGASNLNQGAV